MVGNMRVMVLMAHTSITKSCGGLELHRLSSVDREMEIVAGVGSRRRKTHVERMSDSSEQSAMKRENWLTKGSLPSRVVLARFG